LKYFINLKRPFMRKFLIVVAGLFIGACGSNSNTAPAADSSKTKTDSVAAAQPIKSPYPIVYSSSFTIDDPKYAETLLALWKAYDNGDLAASKNMIADTLTVYMADGKMYKGSRDSMTADVQKERNMYKSVASTVNSVMAVKSDKGEHWALIWGSDKRTDKKGKEETTEWQETWRFNDKGQADLMYQYAEKPQASMKK